MNCKKQCELCKNQKKCSYAPRNFADALENEIKNTTTCHDYKPMPFVLLVLHERYGYETHINILSEIRSIICLPLNLTLFCFITLFDDFRRLFLLFFFVCLIPVFGYKIVSWLVLYILMN